ncbi:hypothetical protein COV94_05940 [Candidatus Woesearchaeota archaeon CG11_big_fil_rev_8_21_14_0_20_57_5]|nr:MAG: hypothetical protein COV94_05940 [Candidatus Woesearchaeota archaeon CG11_big_fil_rev_8_21_14_0_20_57_5]
MPRDRATIQTDLVHLLAQNGYFGQGHPIFAAAQHLTDEDISAHHLSRVDRRRGERSRRMNMGYLIGPLQQTLEEMRQNPSSPSHADLRPYAFDLSSRTKQDFFIKLVQYAVTPAFDVDAFSDLGAMRIVVHEAHYPGLTYLIDNTVRELFRFNPDHYDHNTHALDRYSGTMVDADKYIIQSAHHIPTPGMPYLIEIDNRTGRFRRERIDGEGNTSYYEAIHYAVQTPGGLRLELQLVQRDQHIRQQYQDPVVSHHVYKDSNRVDVMRAAHQVTLGDGRGPNLSELIVMGAIIENLRPSRNNILAAIGDTP